MQEVREREKKSEEETTDKVVTLILEEARMVLPGIQALLGFQLVAVFNQGFKAMPAFDQYLHLAAIIFSVNSICFLLTPAALHRQSQPLEVSRRFAKRSSALVFWGMIPLLLSIVLDTYVVFEAVLHQAAVSCAFAGVVLIELVFCWIIWPQMCIRKKGPSVVQC